MLLSFQLGGFVRRSVLEGEAMRRQVGKCRPTAPYSTASQKGPATRPIQVGRPIRGKTATRAVALPHPSLAPIEKQPHPILVDSALPRSLPASAGPSYSVARTVLDLRPHDSRPPGEGSRLAVRISGKGRGGV